MTSPSSLQLQARHSDSRSQGSSQRPCMLQAPALKTGFVARLRPSMIAALEALLGTRSDQAGFDPHGLQGPHALVRCQTTTLNIHRGATVIKKPSNALTKSPPLVSNAFPLQRSEPPCTATARTSLFGARTLIVGAGSRVTVVNLRQILGQSRMLPRLPSSSLQLH
jgi:hypothetical protein